MRCYAGEKIALFIDGSNLYAARARWVLTLITESFWISFPQKGA